MASKTLTKFALPRILSAQFTRKGLVNGPNVKFYSTPPAAVQTLEYIKIHKAGAKSNVGVITLNRPKVVNAICTGLMKEVAEAVTDFEKDKSVGAIIITGHEKVFVGGADVREMLNTTYAQSLSSGLPWEKYWNQVSANTKPLIAAVNGFCFTAGCELAMMCDIIYAGETAIFSQSEIPTGLVPGAGGTQRLPRYIGKSKAMEMVLTGEQVTAHEAEKMGLVSKVFPVDKLLEEAVKLGERISRNSQLFNAMGKESINTAYETTLQEGLHFERRNFYGTFATKDRTEGLTAFLEKRPPKFTHE